VVYLDRIWPRSSDLPGLPWSELIENPEEYFHPSLRLKPTITLLRPEKMSPADLRNLSNAIILFQSNAETSSCAIFQSRAVISKARDHHLMQKEVERVDAQEPQEIFDHSRSPSPCIVSPLDEVARSTGTPSLPSSFDEHSLSSATSAPRNPPSTPNINEQSSTPSRPASLPVAPNDISLNSDACEPYQSTTPAALPKPNPATKLDLAPSTPLPHTPSPPHSSAQPPPISTAPRSLSVPPYTQSLPTSEPQKRKRDIVDEAPPEDLGRRSRKITKKAQGRNYDEKSGDEEKDELEESASECVSMNGRGGRGRGGGLGSRGRGGGKGGASRGKNGKGGAPKGKNGKGGAPRGKKRG
jgi:hypothetical protein